MEQQIFRVQGLPRGAPFPIDVGEGRLSTKTGVLGSRTLIIRCDRGIVEMECAQVGQDVPLEEPWNGKWKDDTNKLATRVEQSKSSE